MAVEIATAYVSILPSARGFGANLSRELDGQMASAGASAGQSASSSFGRVFAVGITAAATAASAGIVALGTKAATFGLKVASSNEQAMISFTTLLGSADKASTLIADMKKMAAETPFQFSDLQEAASSLLSIGINADKVLPIMKTLGDVTSGMGTGAEGVKRATIAIQQMNAAGRITAEDLNQLRDAGIPVFDLLAGATGTASDELSAMAQNGKLGRKELEQLMTALETGKGLERFTGLMQKQSQSLAGLISTLKDNLSQGLADAMAPAVVAIKAQLPGLADAISGGLKVLGPTLTDIVAKLINIVAQLVPAVTPFLQVFGSTFVSVLSGLGAIVLKLAGPFAFLAEVLVNEIGGAVAELLPELGALLDAVFPLAILLTRLAISASGALAPALSALIKAATPLVGLLSIGLAKAFGRLVDMDIASLFERLTPIFDQIFTALGPLVDVFLIFANDVAQTIADLLPDLVTGFTMLALAFLPMLPELTVLAQQLLPVVVQLFRDLAPDLIQLIRVAIPLMEAMTRLRVAWYVLLSRVLIPFLPVIVHLANVVLPILQRVLVPIVETMLHWVDVLSQSKAGIAILVTLLGTGFMLKFVAHLVLATIQGYNLLTVLTLVNAAMAAQRAISAEGAAAAEAGTAVSLWQQVGTGIRAAASSSLILRGAMLALNVVMSPWFYIPVLIAAVAAAFVIAYNDVKPFHDLVDSIWEGFQKGLDVVREFIGFITSGDFGKADEMLASLGQSILDGLGSIGSLIAENAGTWALAALDGIKNLGSAIADWITGTAVPLIAAAAGGLLNAFIWWITDALPHIALGLFRLWLYLQRFLYTILLPWLLQTGWNLLGAFIGWIKDAVPAALSALGAFLSSILPWFTGTAIPWLIDNTQALGAALWSWIAEAVPAALAQLGEWLGAIGAWITGTALPWLASVVGPIAGAFLGWLVDVVPKLVVGLAGLIVAFGVWYYGTAIPWLLRAGVDLLGALLHFIQEAPGWIASGFNLLLQNIGGWIVTAALWIADKAAGLAEALWGWIKEAVPAALGQLGEWLGALGSWITDTALPAIGDKAGELVGGLWGWISEALPKALGALGGFLAGIGVWVAETAVPWLISKGLELLAGMVLWMIKLNLSVPYYLAQFLLAFIGWLPGAITWLRDKASELGTAFLGWAIRLPAVIPMLLAQLLWKIGEFIVAAVPWIIEHAIALYGAILGWINDAVAAAPGLLLGFLTQVGLWVLDFVPWLLQKVYELELALLGWITHAVAAAPGLLAGWGSAILDFITGLPKQIADAAKNMFIGLTNAFLAAVNWIIRTWNAIELKIPEVDLPGIGKVGGFTLKTENFGEIPYLQSFAKGGRPPTNRPSLVGELGPELFWPKAAGTIVPNDALAAGSGGLNIGNVTVTGQERPTETAFALRSELRWLTLTGKAA
jgi:tape measure domain-containing protein